MSKGIELPVNVLVIVAIAVIVLIGLIVLLGAGLGGANPIFTELEKATACGAVKQNGCVDDPASIKVSNRTGFNTLGDICEKYFKPSVTDAKECRTKACGCPP